MADIFISYASEDRNKVKLFVKAFEDQGWSVWWDRNLLFGRPFDQVIRTELRTAGCIVVVWTENAAKSLYVIGEARDAVRTNNLISVFFSLPSTEIPYDLQAINGVELMHWDGNTSTPDFRRLLRGISDIISQVPQNKTSEETDPKFDTGGGKIPNAGIQQQDPNIPPMEDKKNRNIDTERKKSELLPVDPCKKAPRLWLLKLMTSIYWIIGGAIGGNIAGVIATGKRISLQTTGMIIEPIIGGIGGFIIGLILLRIFPKFNLSHVFFTAIGWTIAGAIGWFISLVITVGLFSLKHYVSIDIYMIIAGAIGGCASWAIGGGVLFFLLDRLQQCKRG